MKDILKGIRPEPAVSFSPLDRLKWGQGRHLIFHSNLYAGVHQRVSTIDRAQMRLLSRKGNRNILPFVFIHFRKE